MKIAVFDTETTSLEKPFCYNIGYVIADTEKDEILCEKDFVCEQVWHNLPLFESAYYADKRPLYVARMRAGSTKMDKFGYICAEMRRDFKRYGVEKAFAFNSSFDEKVFAFNCEWFKVINPFEEIPISDIRGFVHYKMVNETYRKFCEDNGYFTESGHYSTTAETVFRFITNNTEFNEEHTALADSQIEYEILRDCCGGDESEYHKDYIAFRSIQRVCEKELTLTDREKKVHKFKFFQFRMSKDKTKITLI